MSRLECSECHDICDTTARTVVLPFVCDECQKAPGLLAAMAPLQIEESDNHACDSASVENTTLLIEDLSNQLALSQVEAETLRTLLLAVENANEGTTRRLRENVVEKLISAVQGSRVSEPVPADSQSRRPSRFDDPSGHATEKQRGRVPPVDTGDVVGKSRFEDETA